MVKARHTGLKVGYTWLLTGFTPGPHSVCTAGRDIGPGVGTTLGCRTVTVPAPTAAQLLHYPHGKVESAAVKANTVTVKGWAVDADAPTTPLRRRCWSTARSQPRPG